MLRILFLVGKLADRQEDAFSLPANSPGSSLIYLLDLLSFRRFLIDSGAYVSVFLALRSASSSGVRLVTANGSSLTCSCSRIIPLRFVSHRFDWPFQLALISLPSLELLFSPITVFSWMFPTREFFASAAMSSSSLRASLLSTPQCISDLLSEFPDVLFSNGFMASKPCNQIQFIFRLSLVLLCLLSLDAWILRSWPLHG